MKLWRRIRQRKRPYSPVDLPPPSALLQFGAAAFTGLALFILLFSLGQFWSVSPGLLPLLLWAAGATAFGWLAWRSPLVAWGLCGLVLAALPLLAHRFTGIYQWLLHLEAQLQGVVDQIRAQDFQLKFDPTFGHVLLLLCGAGLAVLFLRGALGYGRALGSLVVGTLILLSEWLQYHDPAATHLSLFLPCMLGLWAVGNLAYRSSTWAKQTRTVRYPATALPALFLIVLVLVGMFISPRNLPAIDLGTVSSRFNSALPVWAKNLRGDGPGLRFGMQATGFSQTGSLGGPAAPDDRVAFTARVSGHPSDTLYLRGMTANTYNNSSWDGSGTTGVTMQPGGYAASNYPSDVPTQLTTVAITPATLRTSSLFSPLEFAGLNKGPRSTLTLSGELLASTSVRTPYEVQARVPGFNDAQIRSHGLHGGRITPPTSVEEKNEYTADLQLPSAYSPRVVQLAHHLTDGVGDDYAKTQVIAAYLRQNFPYNLNAPNLPHGRDFVDYFLFDAHTGYCTSFSSAMVVMLRSVGIPARWVQGFVLPPTLGQAQSDGTTLYEVRNTFAHAWVEVYFTGYGWVTFDPTPRTDVPTISYRTPLPTVATPDTSNSDASTPNPSPARNKQLPEDQTPDSGSASAGGVGARNWRGLVAAAASTALLLIALSAWLLRRRRRAAAAQDPATLARAQFQRFVRLMAVFGLERTAGTTAIEYARAVARLWPMLADAALAAAQDYTVLAYGPPQQEAPTATIARLQTLLEAARRAVQHRYGWFALVIYPALPRWWRRRMRPVPMPGAAD